MFRLCLSTVYFSLQVDNTIILKTLFNLNVLIDFDVLGLSLYEFPGLQTESLRLSNFPCNFLNLCGVSNKGYSFSPGLQK